MKEKQINDLSGYRELISKLKDTYLFRGIDNEDYKLIPKIGRLYEKYKIPKDQLIECEFEIFKNFILKATEYQNLPDKDLYILALAQHHGLWTRLLDWTTDAFVALYFAIKSVNSGNSVVYAYKHDYNITTRTDIFEDNYLEKNAEVGEDIIRNPRYPENFFFMPPVFSPRISVQSGILQAFPDPTKPFVSEDIIKIIINGKIIKKKMLESLYLYGFNEYRLFPGLDNLCLYLNNDKLDKYNISK